MRTEIRFLYSDGFTTESLWMDAGNPALASTNGVIPCPPRATLAGIQIRQVPADSEPGEDTETFIMAKYDGNPFAWLLDNLADGKAFL
jgi:hypothetical protein